MIENILNIKQIFLCTGQIDTWVSRYGQLFDGTYSVLLLLDFVNWMKFRLFSAGGFEVHLSLGLKVELGFGNFRWGDRFLFCWGDTH